MNAMNFKAWQKITHMLESFIIHTLSCHLKKSVSSQESGVQNFSHTDEMCSIYISSHCKKYNVDSIEISLFSCKFF